jgi:hypothetical protein
LKERKYGKGKKKHCVKTSKDKEVAKYEEKREI